MFNCILQLIGIELFALSIKSIISAKAKHVNRNMEIGSPPEQLFRSEIYMYGNIVQSVKVRPLIFTITGVVCVNSHQPY